MIISDYNLNGSKGFIAGKTPIPSKMSDEKYETMLDKKLIEEVYEYIENKNTEELADILEVIYTICNIKGISRENLEKIRKEKSTKRGSFKDKILLKEVLE